MQLQCLCANLMICSFKFKKYVVLKNVAWDFALLLLVLKLYQVFISLPLWINWPVIGLFSVKLQQFFLAYVGGVLGTNLFSQFGYLANNNNEKHSRYFF